MKLLHILSLLLIALVSLTSAQRQRCRGGANNANCAGGSTVGRSGIFCRSARVWAYDGPSNQCRLINYLGCGGNQNRWCTQAECQRRCRRP